MISQYANEPIPDIRTVTHVCRTISNFPLIKGLPATPKQDKPGM